MIINTHFSKGDQVNAWCSSGNSKATVTKVKAETMNDEVWVYYDLSLENGSEYEDVVEEELVEYQAEFIEMSTSTKEVRQ